MIHRTLPLLAALLLAGGCMSPARSAGGGGGRYHTASVQRTGGSNWRHARYRRPPAPAMAKKERAPAADSEESGGSPGAGDRAATGTRNATASTSPAATRPAVGQASTTGTTAAVAKGAQVPPTRLIIYRGQLGLLVIQLKEAMDAAQKLALEMGAYLQSRANNVLTFRVPVDRFQPLLKALEGVGEVAQKSIHAEDVTQQYYDLEVRLKAAQAVLGRLKALLAQAKNVEESLAIEREMARLLEKIERFKGSLRYLRHHASLSTLTVHFRVRPRYSRPIHSQWRSPFGWVKSLGLWRMMSF